MAFDRHRMTSEKQTHIAVYPATIAVCPANCATRQRFARLFVESLHSNKDLAMRTLKLMKNHLVFCLLGSVAVQSYANDQGTPRVDKASEVSPARQISPTPSRQRRDTTSEERAGQRNGGNNNTVEFRSIDGTANNLNDNLQGAALTPLRRSLTASYADGLASLAGANRPSARLISNLVFAQANTQENPLGALRLFMAMGSVP